MACLAIFLRFARKPKRVLESPTTNSYGISIIHYGGVTWVLHAMLKVPLPDTAKGLIVFVCKLALCWAVIAAVRRIPAAARVIQCA